MAHLEICRPFLSAALFGVQPSSQGSTALSQSKATRNGDRKEHQILIQLGLFSKKLCGKRLNTLVSMMPISMAMIMSNFQGKCLEYFPATHAMGFAMGDSDFHGDMEWPCVAERDSKQFFWTFDTVFQTVMLWLRLVGSLKSIGLFCRISSMI